ncbi:MAG: aminoacyl-tRNA hydrolase [Bacteroidales bacterium]|nr:aminoacyl-tRNA hydrolase [Bacteroidales bacterium]
MDYLIAGLGNIGSQYANTRHNVGFLVANALADDLKVIFAAGRYAEVAKTRHKGREICIIKPGTYMNLSGKAVLHWIRKESVPPENLLVVVDDIHLPLGALRLRQRGGDGGHNGMISIAGELDTNEFPRLRVGIGGDFPKGAQVDYVLGEWLDTEIEILRPAIKTAVEMIKSFIFGGIDRTMTRFNRR